ncbi:MAG: helical backbone metal receptor [Myxococcota bacterium]
MRIVSLTCSNTEIVCALGAAERLVGVDDHSDFPVEVVTALPRVGPDLQIDPDKVAALEPDLVLASLTVPGHEKVVASIEARGLPAIAPAPETLDDVYGDIRDIAGRLGLEERGEQLVAEMQAAMPPVSVPDRPRILVEWWPKPVIVPGRRSWVTDLIRLAGGENPAGDWDVLSTPITDDQAQELRPDAAVISWCGVPFEKYRPDVVERREAWKSLPALVGGQIHSVPEAFLGRPGPRLVDGYRALRAIVEGLATG